VTSEGLWAVPVGPGQFRLDNIPWFVRGVSAEDIVAAERDKDGVWWFSHRLEWGGHLTIRVALLVDGPLRGDLQGVCSMRSKRWMYRVKGCRALSIWWHSMCRQALRSHRSNRCSWLVKQTAGGPTLRQQHALALIGPRPADGRKHYF
jgi:hypothetical protein